MTLSEDQDVIDASARLLGLELPPACRAGVAQNLVLLRGHMAILEAAPDESDADE